MRKFFAGKIGLAAILVLAAAVGPGEVMGAEAKKRVAPPLGNRGVNTANAAAGGESGRFDAGREKSRRLRLQTFLLKQTFKFEEAARLYREFASTLDWLDGRSQYLYEAAQSYWEAGRYGKSKELFAEISRAGGASLAPTLKDKVDFAAARSALLRWGHIDSARFALAAIYQMRDNHKEAQEIYRLIKEESPVTANKRRAVFALAQEERLEGKKEEAVKALEELLAEIQKEPAAIKGNRRGGFFTKSPGNSQSGIANPVEAFVVDEARIYLALTDIYTAKKNYRKAVSCYEKLTKMASQGMRREQYLFLLAQTSRKAGLKDKARAAYEEIVAEEKRKMEKRRAFLAKKNSTREVKMSLLGQLAEEELAELKKDK